MKRTRLDKDWEKILVYDFNASGHCPGWMYLAASGFQRTGAEVVVSCRLEAPEVRPWAERLSDLGCRVVAVPKGDICHATDAAALARREGIKRVFFTNFDSVVYEMGKHRVSGALDGLDIGGIWLRPILREEPRGPLRRIFEKIVRNRGNKLKRKHARAVLNNWHGLTDFLPHQRRVARVRLFLTSNAATDELGSLLMHGEALTLCDPWLTRSTMTRSEGRAALGLDDSRIVLLHFGTSRPEKGLKDVCESMLGLEDNVRNRLLLLRVGRVDHRDSRSLHQLEQCGAAHVIDRYVSENELSAAYAACNWVLLPYRMQSETSGVLIHAAAHSRPVISSDYGWIGHSTRDYSLGLLFRHMDTASLAEKLVKVVEGNIHDWSTDGLKRFADANSPDSFQETLVSQWLCQEV